MQNIQRKRGTIAAAFLTATFLFWPWAGLASSPASDDSSDTAFAIRSIDTVKSSRDLAREKLNDPSYDAEIGRQLDAIAASGANYAAIDTPYDSEFLPYLRRWVQAARERGLSVWFRGNFSGWENWFGYAKIDRAQHEALLSDFIAQNPDLFEDGDIFDPCPESEVGGPGDPRHNGDLAGHRAFLIREHQIAGEAFAAIGKQVTSYSSMGLATAKAVLDPETAQSLGNVAVIDDYTVSPEQFGRDIDGIIAQSGGAFVAGEFGAPLPEINGSFTEQQQASYVSGLLGEMQKRAGKIAAVNYWALKDSSTALLNPDGTPRQVYGVLKKFYGAHVNKNPDSAYAARYWNAGSGPSPALPSGPPAVSKSEPDIHYSWDSRSPYPEVNPDHFIAVWTKNQYFDAGLYDFSTLSDDGIRVLLDGRAIIDQWNDHGPTIFSSIRPVTRGVHALKIEYYENAGGAVAQFDFRKLDKIPAPFLAKYYNNQNASGTPVSIAVAPRIEYVWHLGPPAKRVNADHFSAVFTKRDYYSSGQHTFTVQADDGVRLYVDGQLLADGWKDQPLGTYTATPVLAAGIHDIRIEYYENTGEASIIFTEQ